MTISCVQSIGSVCSASTTIRRQKRKQGERTEAEIIRLAQAGDVDAFEHLHRAHSRRVYAICLRMTRNPSLAEDLTQEAFLQVFRKIQTFRGTSAFSTWLYRVAFNTVLMKIRKKRLNEMSLETCETEDDSRAIAQRGATDARVAGSVERLTLDKALRKLPRGYKRVLLLHDVFGYEHHEIAKAFGCSDGTSKSQLHKARKCMRRILQSDVSTKATFETVNL